MNNKNKYVNDIREDTYNIKAPAVSKDTINPSKEKITKDTPNTKDIENTNVNKENLTNVALRIGSEDVKNVQCKPENHQKVNASITEFCETAPKTDTISNKIEATCNISNESNDKSNLKSLLSKGGFNTNIENLLQDNQDGTIERKKAPELKSAPTGRKASEYSSKYKDTPSFSLKEMFAIITITGIICAFAGGAVINYKYSTKNGTSYATLLKDENLKEFLDVYATLNEDYYASVDKKNAIDGAIDGLMKKAYDDYTSYLDKDEASSLNNSLNGTYEGVGISISNEIPGLIVKVYADSPAKKAGLQENDYITAINSQEIINLTSNDIAKLIKESQNKKVSLTIKRGEEIFTVDLNVETLSVPAIDYKVLSNNNKKVGYLAISTFSSTLGSQVKNALEEMESAGIESLILDLRNNGGGLLSAAVDVANLFLEKGKAIYGLEGKDGKATKFYYDTTGTRREYPIVVLMNGATASASEILASALIDSYGATSVGTTSYGKGKVQQTKQLSDGSLVKYTTSLWVTPNNECIDTYGISPEYGVELDIKYDEDDNIIGLTDTQLAKARSLLGLLEYDETNPKYEEKMNSDDSNNQAAQNSSENNTEPDSN